MEVKRSKELGHFYVAGISYKKTDATTRGRFAVNETQYQQILQAARQQGLDEVFIISTCNRTEIYGFADSANQLIALVCSVIGADTHLFHSLAYIKSGEEAVLHLYQVGAGLDSQILGDYEVSAQVKNAARFAKKLGSLGTFTERMINSVLQVSKLIKNETELSTGTVSVAFAAVQLLKKTVPQLAQKKILLFGVGKIGRNACKNLLDYTGVQQVTLINRTDSTAAAFANEHGLRFAPYASLIDEIRQAEVILVATNAPTPTILKSYLEFSGPKTIIDLSIPHNVENGVRSLPHVVVANVDDLSRIQDETLLMRQAEVPKALSIIREHMQDFLYWYQMRKHAVVLQAVKNKLSEIHTKEILQHKRAASLPQEEVEMLSSRIIQKLINMMASKVRQANGKGDQMIELIGQLFEAEVKN